MYDIDAGRSHALRLDGPRAPSVDEEIAAIEKQMEALSLRHCELMEAKRVAFAQSQPISASADERRYFKGFEPSVSQQEVLDLIVKGGHISDCRMADGLLVASITAKASATDNDFWTHRHRVLSGTTPMISRSTGHIDRMTAAAVGEIEDPAAGLRRERN